MKIYLAGKIAKGDWRHLFVPQLRTITPTEWKTTTRLPMRYGHIYTGPFFIACDHGCYHDANTHGAAAINTNHPHQSYTANCGGAAPTQQEVIEKACAGIRRSDYVVVWADGHFDTAYGTHAEIGFAKALGKKIAVIHDHTGWGEGTPLGEKLANLDGTLESFRDLWFIFGMADFIQEADSPEQGIGKLLKFLEGGAR